MKPEDIIMHMSRSGYILSFYKINSACPATEGRSEGPVLSPSAPLRFAQDKLCRRACTERTPNAVEREDEVSEIEGVQDKLVD